MAQQNQSQSGDAVKACDTPATGGPRAVLAAAAIVFPLGGAVIDVSANCAVNVYCRVVDDTVDQVKARCYALGGAIPGPPTAVGFENDGFTILPKPPATDFRFRGNVPVFRTDIGGTGNNNSVVAYAHDSITEVWTQIGSIVLFRAITQLTQTCSVTAKSAVWFSWALENGGGPFGEPVAECRTAPIAVPANAATLTIAADGSNWLSGDELTDANGFGSPASLVTPNFYKNTSLNSDAIEDVSLEIGSLIYMLADDLATPTVQVPIKAGVGPTVIDFASTTRRKWLFLAFHDIENWGKNELAVQARITWTV